MNMLKVVGARGFTMVVGLICGFLTTGLVIRDAGVETYAFYSFLIAIPALVPFTDLGAGAALVNRIAGSKKPDDDDDVRRTMLSIVRIMLGSAAALAVINATLYLTGGWSLVLGSVASIEHAESVAFLCVMLFALSVPFSIGARIFLGLEKQHRLVLLQGIQSPLTLGLVFLTTTVAPGTSGAYLSASAYISLALVAIVGLLGASRFLPRSIRWTAANLARVRGVKGTRVMDIGLPLLVQTIASPVASQLGRFILAQTVTAQQLAVYGMAAQVFFALQGVIAMAGMTLWPVFARQRANGERARPFAISAMFAGGAAVCAFIVCVASGPFFALISNGEVVVPWSVLIAFSAVLIVQAALYPLGMYLMDKDGARFQTVPVLVMVVVNIGLSVVLAPALGVVGPIIATAVATFTCQVVPFAIHIAGRIRRNGM
jgi:O-antigen/teichoic acid export membrane protein